MEGNDDRISDRGNGGFTGLAGGDSGISDGGDLGAGTLGGGTLGGDGGTASGFGAAPDAGPLEAFGGPGEAIDPAPAADILAETAPTTPAEGLGGADPLEAFGGPARN